MYFSLQNLIKWKNYFVVAVLLHGCDLAARRSRWWLHDGAWWKRSRPSAKARSLWQFSTTDVVVAVSVAAVAASASADGAEVAARLSHSQFLFCATAVVVAVSVAPSVEAVFVAVAASASADKAAVADCWAEVAPSWAAAAGAVADTLDDSAADTPFE